MGDHLLLYLLGILLLALVCAGLAIVRLQRQVRNQRTLVAAVSHDLRSSLTRLRLRVDRLDDDTARQGLGRVVDDMQSLVQATQDFSCGGGADESLRRVSLDALLESLCTDMNEEGHAVTWRKPAHSLVVLGRPAALRRGFQNLIQNALKYGERAEVSMSVKGAHVETTIRDQGPGIPDEELENVLMPFYRVDASRSQNTRGMGLGLGLPIVQNVVNAHGGSLTLHNLVDGGLAAAVSLPLLRPSTGAE